MCTVYMKSIPQMNDVLNFVRTADFYNKIQITASGVTETLWYLNEDQKWTAGAEDGSSVDISEADIISKLQNVNDDCRIVIAGNDISGVLTYKF